MVCAVAEGVHGNNPMETMRTKHSFRQTGCEALTMPGLLFAVRNSDPSGGIHGVTRRTWRLRRCRAGSRPRLNRNRNVSVNDFEGSVTGREYHGEFGDSHHLRRDTPEREFAGDRSVVRGV